MAEWEEQERKQQPLRVGIIGLGRHWQRWYRPALHALRQEISVVAVSDQLLARAQREAHRLGCRAASGVVELLEHPEIEAVLLLAPQWYGLWPLEMACRLRKPVFCGVYPYEETQQLDDLHAQITACGLLVMTPLTASFLPSLVCLRQLLQEQLGALCWLLAARVSRQSPLPTSAGGLRPSIGLLHLLDACDWLLGRAPERLLAMNLPPRLTTVLLDYGQDLGAQLTLVEKRPAPLVWRLEVVGTKGWAFATPEQLSWSSAQGQYTQRFCRSRRLPEQLLRAFCQAVRSGQLSRPTLADIQRLLEQWHCVRHSQASGGWVALSTKSP